MSSPHTPGPWFYDAENDRVVSRAKDEYDEPYSVISTLGTMGGVDTGADARLIAAAPDLLAALEAILSMADSCRGTGELEGTWLIGKPQMDQARAAIARAKGEEAGRE